MLGRCCSRQSHQGGLLRRSNIIGDSECQEEAATGTSLTVQWLRLRVSTAGGMGLIPGHGIRILQAMQRSQKKLLKKKKKRLLHGNLLKRV